MPSICGPHLCWWATCLGILFYLWLLILCLWTWSLQVPSKSDQEPLTPGLTGIEVREQLRRSLPVLTLLFPENWGWPAFLLVFGLSCPGDVFSMATEGCSRSSSWFGHLPELLYPPPTSHLGFEHWWEPVQFTLPSAALCWHQLVFSVRPSCPSTPGHKKKFGAQLSWENPLFPRGSAPMDLWHSTLTSLSVRNAGLLTLPSPVYWVRICYFRFLVIHMLLKVVLSSGSTKG